MYKGLGLLLQAVCLFGWLSTAQAMYCGDRNCYDVIGVKENASKKEIVDSYRKLAREWHPDKNQHRAKEADREFSAIAHAYDILRNEDSRRDYDYALRHPEEFAYNQVKYYYTQYYTKHVKFNPVLVLLVALLAWSAFDYSARLMCHKQAIKDFKDSTEYKIRLKRFKEEKIQEAERSGLVKRKLNGKRTRKEIEEFRVDESELEDQIQVHGSYRKPKLQELAIVQFWFMPWYAYKGLAWHWRWIKRYHIQKKEYTEEDKEYIVRGIINMSEDMWDSLPDKERAKIMAKELWIPEKEAKFRESQRIITDDFSEE